MGENGKENWGRENSSLGIFTYGRDRELKDTSRWTRVTRSVHGFG